MYDAIFIPGGTHIERLRKQGHVLHFLNETYKHCKPIGLMAEAIELLKISSVELVNSNAEDGAAHDNMGVVIARDKGHIESFLGMFETAIIQHRHWERSINKDSVPA